MSKQFSLSIIRSAFFIVAMLTLVTLVLNTSASAHPDSISLLRISLEKNVLRVTLTLSTHDLENWFPPTAHPDYLNDLKSGLEKSARGLIEIKLGGTAVTAKQTRTVCERPGSIQVEWCYDLPADVSKVQVSTRHLEKMPAGHSQLLFVEDNRGTRKPDEDPPVIAEKTLNLTHPSADVEVPPPVGK